MNNNHGNIDDIVNFLNNDIQSEKSDMDFTNVKEVQRLMNNFNLSHGAPIVFMPGFQFKNNFEFNDESNDESNDGYRTNHSEPKIVEISDDEDNNTSSDSQYFEPHEEPVEACTHKCQCYNELLYRLNNIENMLENIIESKSLD